MTTSKTKPALTITDGAIKASVWRNNSEKGAFYSVTFSRRYKRGDGEFADSYSYSGSELLRLARLAESAYEQAHALREQDKLVDENARGAA